MNVIRMIPWRGLRRFVWLGLVVALAGAGGVFDGVGPRAALAQGELFVSNRNGNSITVYNRTASLDSAPLRTITGWLGAPQGLAVDTVNNELLVANANFGSIQIYSRTARNGDAPLRMIQGLDTMMNDPRALAVDTVNNEVLVTNFATDSITVYSRTDSGNVKPKRTIQGLATGLVRPTGLAVDTVNNEVLVVNFGTILDNWSITVYGRTQSGNVTPLRTIQGGATGLGFPIGLALDTVNNEVLATNGNTITVHSRTANGNVAPLRTITNLSLAFGIAVDTVNNEVLVTSLIHSITVYDRTLSGHVAPLRTLKGQMTGLNSPQYLAVTTDTTIATCPTTFDFDFSGTQYADCFRDVHRGGEINAGPDVGGTDHDSLVFTGLTGSGGATWLTLYDDTPSTTAPGPTFGAQTVCADILFARFNNMKGAGLVALLNEGVGQRGLALIVADAGHTDLLRLATVEGDPTKQGKLNVLDTVKLKNGIAENVWYRLVMTVDPAVPRVKGKVFTHTFPLDPNSPLGVQIGETLRYEPGALPAGVSPTGQNGILAQAVSAVVDLSVTNFTNDPALCLPSPP